ncbi:hypothetical protein BSY18_4108 (plasmid) [Blastomonas sp. RAC04]|uniref:hypothetical protein n=1 Tax=Blastomonas sp. RAC04 TaxID=1842535 RepID=UPI00083D05E5|nr:hypothetical protein [Blastomonas sp. RAC04]AOF98827.1 hypothetical protein BSY18_4108 [Blastomonas sp. RAC04]
MSAGNEFPIYIKAEYLGGNAIEQAEADIFRLSENSKARFARDFGEIEKIIAKAVSAPRTSAGGLDIGVADANRAAAAASAQAQAAREVAQAMIIQARETNDISQETAEAIVRMQSFERQQIAAAAATLFRHTRID